MSTCSVTFTCETNSNPGNGPNDLCTDTTFGKVEYPAPTSTESSFQWLVYGENDELVYPAGSYAIDVTASMGTESYTKTL